MSKRNEPNHGLDFIHLVKISKKIKKPFHGRFFASYLRKFRPFNKKGIVSCFTRFVYIKVLIGLFLLKLKSLTRIHQLDMLRSF